MSDGMQCKGVNLARYFAKVHAACKTMKNMTWIQN